MNPQPDHQRPTRDVDSPVGCVFRHHPLLGTMVEVTVAASDADAARLDRLAVAEISRLERIFSVFDPDSELERWKRDEVADPSAEFCELMALALDWQVRSGGAFNTAAGVLTQTWRIAADAGVEPSTADLADVAAAIASPRFRITEHGAPERIGDCALLDLNAIAKGWIVDRTVAALVDHLDVDVVVNAGGDLVHHGPVPVRVGIENPLRPYDNEPPVAFIEVADAALATSGRARRGVRIADCWHSHVIDPRSGRTVEHIASISVVAADGATADVVATIAGALEPEYAVAVAGDLGTACLVIDADGGLLANDRWRTLAG